MRELKLSSDRTVYEWYYKYDLAQGTSYRACVMKNDPVLSLKYKNTVDAETAYTRQDITATQDITFLLNQNHQKQ